MRSPVALQPLVARVQRRSHNRRAADTIEVLERVCLTAEGRGRVCGETRWMRCCCAIPIGVMRRRRTLLQETPASLPAQVVFRPALLSEIRP